MSDNCRLGIHDWRIAYDGVWSWCPRCGDRRPLVSDEDRLIAELTGRRTARRLNEEDA